MLAKNSHQLNFGALTNTQIRARAFLHCEFYKIYTVRSLNQHFLTILVICELTSILTNKVQCLTAIHLWPLVNYKWTTLLVGTRRWIYPFLKCAIFIAVKMVVFQGPGPIIVSMMQPNPAFANWGSCNLVEEFLFFITVHRSQVWVAGPAVGFGSIPGQRKIDIVILTNDTAVKCTETCEKCLRTLAVSNEY